MNEENVYESLRQNVSPYYRPSSPNFADTAIDLKLFLTINV